MFKFILALLVLYMAALPLVMNAQDTVNRVPDFSFGKVDPADFMVSSPVVDSNTEAVILADIGSVELEKKNGQTRMIFKKFKRIRIMNNKGIEASSVDIGFSAEENGSGRLKTLRAATYNLERGKVERTELSDKDIFLDRSNGNLVEEKFTFPNVKEGSVIEYTYTVRSSAIGALYPWNFQGGYPRLWSDFKISIPDLYNYVFFKQGSHPLYLKKIDSAEGSFPYGIGTTETTIHTIRWVMKDVPALREEPFTSTLDNYVDGIRFQLSQVPTSALGRARVMDTWQSATNILLTSAYFGGPIGINNSWLKNDLQKITEGCKNDLERAKKIFGFVRDGYSADGHVINLTEPYSLQDIFKRKKGTVAEINLLLVAMLREAGLQADPVVLSTRNNGLTNAAYPITNNFNYVVVKAAINNKTWYLDASRPRLGFGKLPLECYNGHSRVIVKNGYAVYLEPDSLRESKMTTVFVTNDEKDSLYAVVTKTAGYYESLGIRDSLAKTSQVAFFKNLTAQNPVEAVLQNTAIDSLEQYEEPITIHYEMKFDPGSGDLLYFNPMFNEVHKENPFKSAQRQYPVEMPYVPEEMYVLSMEVPKGYHIDELPKSVKVRLNEEDGSFEYSIQQMGNTIQLISRLVLKKAIFQPEEYQSLRDFYAYIVKKQSEDIIFKKIR